ncbi:MAG: excinuclease ABC subunit UvrC [Treponema sp.]|jgi:excinuclease ABC subunit C|nr:excinuclease ABC subunit UvrC [Treponema sp.]
MDHDEFSKKHQALKTAAREAPMEPGVYIMRDEEGRIIYVGKARLLKKRLNSYFSGSKDIKTATLIRRAHSIETIILASEYEALLLENTLIKQHSPRYNINLKDGKTYPVIRITAEEFPRIFRTRHIVEDKSLYFGPFPNVQAVDTMLELVEKLFPLRKCRVLRNRSGGSPRNNKGPCMYYHIGRCMAPCCGKISVEEYRSHVRRVQELLSGETESLIVNLTQKMHEAARELKFERAAQLRNAVRAIEDLSGESAVVDFDPEGRDYISWALEGVFTTFTVFSMRGGKMTGRELFRTHSAADEAESLETFAAAYYNPGRPPPPKIYLALGKGEEGEGETSVWRNGKWGLSRWFREQFGFEPEICPPREKHHAVILAMARQNAQEDLRRRLKERGAGPALDEMRKALGLRARPERIEGFDIAQLDGKHPVASLISFKNGVPDRKNYRHFKLRTVVGVVDDFAAMREAVSRRYSRLLREEKELPDLILIDGGIGQVNAAKGALNELGLDLDIVGLAKRAEELWLPQAKAPVVLSRQSEALKVLQFVRDETHRFATSLNQRLRSGDLFFPVLESVEGIGPRRAAALMNAYAGVAAIAAAAPAELAERCGLSLKAAKAVRTAAKLALEDQAAAKERLATSRSRSRQDRGAAVTLAAEAGAEPSGSAATEPGEAYPK